MSILASLAKAYDRLPDVPRPGYSTEKIGFVISLNDDGTVANVIDLREGDGKKKQPRMMQVPQPPKKASGIKPNLLWENTSYALGVTGGPDHRTSKEYASFKDRHLKLLANTEDKGLLALRLFIESWTPESFVGLTFPEEMKDQAVVFALESERRTGTYLHDRVAARSFVEASIQAEAKGGAVCLVTGTIGPVATLHPSIKNIWGAQSSGASIVAFNQKAFESYGHIQGNNAPVSELAAFKYTTVLNTFLAGKTNRVQIGDASTVFWADASNAETAEAAEGIFAFIVDERTESDKIGAVLSRVRDGLIWNAALKALDPGLEKDVRFYVLGLAPNAARISIRFWFDDDFGILSENYAAYLNDMNFEPWPKDRGAVGLRRLALRTAPARRNKRTLRFEFDSKRVSPVLSGELLRAIMSGGRFPAGLLSLLLLRIRTDGLIDSARVALLKAILVRSMRLEHRLPKDWNNKVQGDYLVRSDPNDPNPARRLGRLFAVVERAQLAALGDEINTTVKDKYLGTAAATPGRVISKLVLDAEQHHIKRLRNGHSDAKWITDSSHARRVGAGLQRDIGQLYASFNESFPSQHSSEEQALFLIGYYQERFGPRTTGASTEPQDDIDASDANEEPTE